MNKSLEIVTLEPVETFCLVAEGGPETFPNTFQRLEDIVPLKGHRFYGLFNRDDGSYRACVQPKGEDDTVTWGLESFTIPGGRYAYRKITGEHDELSRQIPSVFEELAAAHEVYPGRPSIEFYRRLDEFRLYLPVR